MRRQGFTLIEMVITLIVGAILVLGIAGFVELGARGYTDTVERQRLQTQAKFILEKMSREIRNAVPNMLSSNNVLPQATSCISFYPIIDSGYYAVSGADIQFVVGQQDIVTDDIEDLSLVINPTQASPTNNVFPLVNVSSASDTFTIADKASELVGNSVSRRHYLYNPNGRVDYCLIAGQLRRAVNGLNDLPLSATGVSGNLDYMPATVQTNGIVDVDITFSNTQGDESSNFQQQIQVLNVP